MPADETQLLYSLCLHGRGELGLAPDEYAALTMVLLRLLAFKPSNAAASTASTEKKTLNEAAAAAASAGACRGAGSRTVASTACGTQAARAAACNTRPVPAAPTHPAASSRRRTPCRGRRTAPSRPAPDAHRRPRQGRRRADARATAEPARDEPHAQAQRAAFVPTPEDGDFWHATVQQLVEPKPSRRWCANSRCSRSWWGATPATGCCASSANRSTSRPAASACGRAAQHRPRRQALHRDRQRHRQPGAPQQAGGRERQRAAEEIILNDPRGAALMRDFGAKIVPGSIKPV
jgi:DNA polymerase-3 subunit gamma/tau